jgi:hypothetical protein
VGAKVAESIDNKGYKVMKTWKITIVQVCLHPVWYYYCGGLWGGTARAQR